MLISVGGVIDGLVVDRCVDIMVAMVCETIGVVIRVVNGMQDCMLLERNGRDIMSVIESMIKLRVVADMVDIMVDTW